MTISKKCEDLASQFIDPLIMAEWMPRWIERKRYRIVREDSRAIRDMMADMEEKRIVSSEEADKFRKAHISMEDALDREDWNAAEGIGMLMHTGIFKLLLNKTVECECKRG